jgi:hypothetical protein
VNPGVVNTITLGIADTSDSILGSAVFIQAGSFTTTTSPEPASFALVSGGLLALAGLLRRGRA